MEKGQGKRTDTLQTDNDFTHKKYIESEAAIEAVNLRCAETGHPTMFSLKNPLLSIPAADVAPVRHGHWRTMNMACYGGGTIREYECSICEKHQVRESPYCPNCGARMDGDGDV